MVTQSHVGDIMRNLLSVSTNIVAMMQEEPSTDPKLESQFEHLFIIHHSLHEGAFEEGLYDPNSHAVGIKV